VRLGGLAANLARVRSFSDNPAHRDVVAQLIEESAWFIEWTAPEAALETQLSLLDCQRELSRWRHRWGAVWDDPERRGAMAARAGVWAEKFVNLSGLLLKEDGGEVDNS
jgi:hypothetical protein